MKSVLFAGLAFADLRKTFEAMKQADYALTSDETEEHFGHFERMAAGNEVSETLFEDAFPAVNSQLLGALAKEEKQWNAGVSEHFKGWAVGDVKKLMGSPATAEEAILEPREFVAVQEDLPASFDASEKWSECPTIGHIRDQANCGSCWAFGSTEAFNDRLCIASGGKFTEMLSAQDTASCCGMLQCMSMGCNGGQPGMAWKWLVKNGVVTGGDNIDTGKDDTCWPYELEACAHHVKSSKYPACPSGEVPTPSCKTSCVNTDYKVAFGDDKHTGGSGGRSYSLGSVAEIKQSIFDKGPVTGGFTVYADFPAYTSGVYEHKTGKQLGGHAIKIYGWGTEDGTDYWLVANSWNEDWGDKGSFKIKQGDCGIDSQVSAGDVDPAMVEALVV